MTTAAVPFSASNSKVAAANPLWPVRSTLVAPMLPEPIERMSVVPASFVSTRPNGNRAEQIADDEGDGQEGVRSHLQRSFGDFAAHQTCS